MRKAAPRSGLFERLKQHHMFRVASVYATVAYVLILVANAVFPDVGLTREDVRYVIAVLALGFPVVLTLSWLLIPPSKETPEQFSRWRRLRWRMGAVISIAVIAFVTVSGVYLWRLNERHLNAAPAGSGDTSSIVVLPFKKTGAVDQALLDGMQQTMESTLSTLSRVRVISHSALPALQGSPAEMSAVAKAAGATLIVQGSVERDDKEHVYSIHLELISAQSGEPIFTRADDYPIPSPSEALAQQTASNIAGPIHLLAQGRDWLAPGYPTTQDGRALQLLEQALINARYGDPAKTLPILHEALASDPHFAQAHAYLAYYGVWLDNANPNIGNIVQSEIEQAEKLAPDLPEARLADALRELMLNGDDAKALAIASTLQTSLAHTAELHQVMGFALRGQGRLLDALHEFQTEMALDPYYANPVANACLIPLYLRDYSQAENCISTEQQIYPLFAKLFLWGAETRFSHHGDVGQLEHSLHQEWKSTGFDSDWLPLISMQLEAAHFAGRHDEVVRGLKAYPTDCLADWGWPFLSLRDVCVDTFMTESLRLQGKDREARSLAALHIPEARKEIGGPDDHADILHLALLQAFGGDGEAALKSLDADGPLRDGLAQPVDRWPLAWARISTEVAVVLAWSGDRHAAIDILTKSLDAPGGAHAAIVARDPVWRPLYTDPAFAALLAAHGETLARAP